MNEERIAEIKRFAIDYNAYRINRGMVQGYDSRYLHPFSRDEEVDRMHALFDATGTMSLVGDYTVVASQLHEDLGKFLDIGIDNNCCGACIVLAFYETRSRMKSRHVPNVGLSVPRKIKQLDLIFDLIVVNG